MKITKDQLRQMIREALREERDPIVQLVQVGVLANSGFDDSVLDRD